MAKPKLKTIYSRVHEYVHERFMRTVKKYAFSGLQKMNRERHLTLALMYYTQQLTKQGVLPNEDIAQKLGIKIH